MASHFRNFGISFVHFWGGGYDLRGEKQNILVVDVWAEP